MNNIEKFLIEAKTQTYANEIEVRFEDGDL